MFAVAEGAVVACKDDQKIYNVYDKITGKLIHRLVGIKDSELEATASRLTGKKASDLIIEDSGETKPCCKNCGKK